MARKNSFGRHVKNTRLHLGLSIADVAERVGVSYACVYLWEADRTRPREENLMALCKALKLPVTATRAMAAA